MRTDIDVTFDFRRDTAAKLLGSLMVQNFQGKLPIQLLGFSKSDNSVSNSVARLVQIMAKSCRAMLAP
jgi:hypothetical protein